MSALSNFIVCLVEKLPEPEFGGLAAEVFGDIQQESARLASVMESEKCDSARGQTAKTVRFAALQGETLVGWSIGWMEKGCVFYMAHSGVSRPFQHKGIYSSLLAHVLDYAVSQGAVALRSQHSVLNNRMIIYKLARGFYISGLSFDAQMGSLVELTRYLSGPREKLFTDRAVSLRPAEKAR